MLTPRMKISERSDIIRDKRFYLNGSRSINHIQSQNIIDFLNDWKTKSSTLEQDSLARYFKTLRNLIVHTISPHIFERQVDNNGKVILRRFQRDFVWYIPLEEGSGYLLTEDGFRIALNGNHEDGSLFDKYPLSELDQQSKLDFQTILETQDPLTLMKSHLDKINNFIEIFERRN
ncbi:MAG: hypothetical protein KGI33_04155 [Thaumarchaeota archaeon]|nr:hypothetical protein [Nitrososphaerota archaeon]